MIDRTLLTDVLVIGGGGGGLRAAVAAEEAGARVLVVSKGIVGRSGLTQTAVTGFQAAFGFADPRDTPAIHLEDSLRGSYGLADPALAAVFTARATQAVRDLERFGARFDVDAAGKLVQRKLDTSQTYPRSLRKGDSLGVPIMQALRREAGRRDRIVQMHEVLVTKLLTTASPDGQTGGRVCGAMALDVRTGDLVLIQAGAVVLATGGAGELYPVNSNTPDATGDGCALALDAGAELVDLEFVLSLGHAVLHPETVRGVLFTYQYLMGKGARAPFNALGEEFLSRYDPDGSPNPPRHVYARAIFGEVRAGRGSPHGGVWFDPASAPPGTLEEALPSQAQYLRSFGVDLAQPIEVGVAAHYMCGGVRIGTDAQSSVPGLFAVGECAGGPHGAARIGGNSLTELLVFGQLAGQGAAAQAGGAAAAVDPNAAEAEARRVLGLLQPRPDGNAPLRPAQVKAAVQDVMGRQVSVVRSQAGLQDAVAVLDRIVAQDLPAMAPTFRDRACNYDWVEALEAAFLARLGRAIAGAALLRTESRGAHHREDHPATDDAHWRANIRVRWDGNRQPCYTVHPVAAAPQLALAS